jgi:hypothetical protein
LLLAAIGLLLAAATSRAAYFVTDIVYAARRGDGHAVHKLLELDSDAVNATDEAGNTALHWAAVRGSWRIFSELLGEGADVNAVGGDGGTPLHWACHHDRADMVKLLLDAGADTQVSNRWGRTPLHVAARRGCQEVAALLLARGADPNAGTTEGWTPLHVAYRSGQDELVELLLTNGADPQRRDKEGLRPVDSAAQRPVETAADLTQLEDYSGLYDMGSGHSVKIWLEEGRLRIRDFAPDDLYPIGRDRFYCRQEPWQVSFARDDGGSVSSIEIQFLRRTVSGKRAARPEYVGSRVCKSCHLGGANGDPYVTWLRSRHGHAYTRLAADWALFLAKLRPHYHDLEQPIEDQRCLLCHVTGAQDPDSLFAGSFRQQEGVSCEACHGPGSDYIDPEIMSDRESFISHGGVIPDEQTCRSCHRNSDRFDFAEWWPKVAHKRPAKVRDPG